MADPQARATYDRFGKDGLTGVGLSATVNAEELFRQMFEGMQQMFGQQMPGVGGGGGGSGGGGHDNGLGGGLGGIEAMFEQLAGQMFGQMGGAPMGAMGGMGGGLPVFKGPRTAHEHAALLQQLSEEYRSSPTPPESVADQWRCAAGI